MGEKRGKFLSTRASEQKFSQRVKHRMLIPARRQTSKDFDGCESRPSPQSGSTIFLALLLGICAGQATVWGVFYAFDGNFDTYDVESFHEDFWPSSHQKNLAQADCHGSPRADRRLTMPRSKLPRNW